MFFNGFELFSMVNYIITKDALYQLSHSSLLNVYYDIIVKFQANVKLKNALFEFFSTFIAKKLKTRNPA